ncbi:MAG: chorismate synthase [Phycisphaeraceae bacterium]|nr:chorismate synthase [Phycisphaeraceae bacterium]MCB9846958.1 chorismate synthase [Phycisphaeraceae bacterium]
MLDYHTAGESHGPALIALVQGMPAGVTLDMDLINGELLRRQGGYGRGGRQRIETDTAEFLSGVRNGVTIGSPIAVRIANRDSRLDDGDRTPPVYRPRPGHADLAGSVKWLTTDCRGTLERASARETAARTAAGAIARCLLRALDIEVFGFVRSVETARWDGAVTPGDLPALRAARDASEVYCPDESASAAMIQRIRAAKENKDTVGGLVEAHVVNCPMGLGSSVDWRDKLDARLAYAVMGIQAFKSVEIGLGRDAAGLPGSAVHDPIEFDAQRRDTPGLGFTRPTNNAGGLEGGMTNGAPVVVRAAMKPISTLLRGLPSVNLNTKAPERSDYERSDVCAVSAASVVMENVAAFEIARAALLKFGGDSLLETRQNYDAFLEKASMLPLEPPTGAIA